MIFWKLTMGFLLDRLIGDPVWIYHPVRLIGKLITFLEKKTRGIFAGDDRGTYRAGLLTAVLVIAISWAVPALILYVCRQVSVVLAFVLETFWICQILAGKCLEQEAKKVERAMHGQDLQSGRRLLSGLVGRDTQDLTKEEVICAAVETVAENTTDGVIAPMFYIALGGAPLGFAYKAINTLDSMVGYKNDTYLMFGRASARIDDAVNFLPARIAGILMIVSAFLCGYQGRQSWRIYWRDRKNHLSPNSAQTESACAGALGIRLGGTHNYFGKPVEKPKIGEDQYPPDPRHISEVCILLLMTSCLFLFVLDMLRFLWWL